MTTKLEICAGDPACIKVPGVAKPINAGSQKLARRIVACVNFCEGYDSRRMERDVSAVKLAEAYTAKCDDLSAMTKQRDELLAAIRNIAGLSAYDETATEEAMAEIQSVCRAAIAKVQR